MKLIIGIDPGMSGAVAWCYLCTNHDDNALGLDEKVCVEKLGQTPSEIKRLFYRISPPFNPGAITYIEKVHSMPKQGVASTFTFGKAVGWLEGILASLEIPCREVAPTVWQKTVCGALPKEKPARKKEIQRQMQALFPCLVVTPQVADALAILEYGRRKEHAPPA